MGWKGGRVRVGGEGVWAARGGLYLPLGHKQYCCVQLVTETSTIHRIG